MNVISTGMNDDHIRYFASSWSDVVYISSVMAVGWHLILTESSLQTFHMLSGKVMQIEKALINDRLRVLKVFWKFRNSAVYNFAAVSPWNLLFSLKVVYFLTVSVVKTLRINNLKTRTATNAKISAFFICGEAIIYLLLYNLHDCTFNHGISNDHCFFSGRRVYKTIIFFIIRFFFLSLTWRLLLCTNLHFLSLGDLLPLWLPWIYWTGTWWGWW